MKELRIDKRWIAGILVVLAIATLFFDFTTLTRDAKDQLGFLNGSFNGSSIVGTLFGVSTYVSGYGTNEYALYNRIARMFRSGGLSILETRNLLSTMNQVANYENSGEPALQFAVILLTICLIVTLLAGGFALYGIYRNRRARGYWFAAMLLVLTIIEGILVSSLNQNAWYALVTMTAWPFIGLACAIGSIVLCYSNARSFAYDNAGAALANGFANAVQAGKALGKQVGRKAGKAGRAAASAAANAASMMNLNGWTCPKCGNAVEPGGRFCSACGTSRPERLYCPKCGSESKTGAAFCSRCGFKLADISGGFQSTQARPEPAYQAQPGPAVHDDPIQDFQVSPDYSTSPTLKTAPKATTVRMPQSAVSSLPLTVAITQQQTGISQTRHLDLGDSVTIGRKSSCNLSIDDNTVSGTHLRLDRDGSDLYVTDLNSSNGTKLNGVALKGQAPLNSGDELIIGLTRLSICW